MAGPGADLQRGPVCPGAVRQNNESPDGENTGGWERTQIRHQTSEARGEYATGERYGK